MDSYSKWLEVSHVNTTSAAAIDQGTLEVLRNTWASGHSGFRQRDRLHLREFQEFVTRNGICHIRSVPFHPATNGQAEQMVRTTKDSLRRLVTGEWQARVAEFLFYQHATPCTLTGRSPAELLMGHKLAMCLDRLHPDLALDKCPSSSIREVPQGFFPGDTVYVENHRTGQPWVLAKVICVTGPQSYKVSTADGLI